MALLLAVVLATGCAIYLVVGGARFGAPMVFVILAALALTVALYLLARAALAVMAEPQADEVRVATGRRRKELEREKQLLLKALKELSFDHEMHKISDADYQEISATYRARAVRVMRQLDEGASAYRQQIEEELAARRAAHPAAEADHDGAPAAAPDGAAGARARTGKAAAERARARAASDDEVAVGEAGEDRPRCASCGTANEPDAVFCKKCGARVAGEAAAPVNTGTEGQP